MNLYGKIALVGAGVLVGAVAAATVAGGNNSIDTVARDTMQSAGSSVPDEFLTVSQHPGITTDFTKAAESTINGVVSIKSFASAPSYNQQSMPEAFNDPFFEFFFGPQRRQQAPRRQQQRPSDEDNQQPLGLGSGVILSPDGYIVTNNHVINGADRLEVTLNDNRTFNATVVGNDPATDLALIKIDATGLPTIPMGDSDGLKVGEWVLAVGNPFGFTSTVTTGIVSAKARSISSSTQGRPMGIESYIQTDAAVNPGNSGGALVNLNGELVGINTAIYSQTGNYAGYSFAIPTSIVTKIVTDIRQYGQVQRAVLGISYQEVTPRLAKDKGLKDINSGLYVAEVSDRSSAMEAGIKPGDVITAINGHPTHNSAQLLEQIARHRPGDEINISYVRDGKIATVPVTLYNSQGSTKITAASSVNDLGCAFRKVNEETMRSLRISGGQQVTGLKDGKLKDAGVKDGFIILYINNERVGNVEDIERIHSAITKSEQPDKVMFLTGIYPTGKKAYYAVDLAQ